MSKQPVPAARQPCPLPLSAGTEDWENRSVDMTEKVNIGYVVLMNGDEETQRKPVRFVVETSLPKAVRELRANIRLLDDLHFEITGPTTSAVFIAFGMPWHEWPLSYAPVGSTFDVTEP